MKSILLIFTCSTHVQKINRQSCGQFPGIEMSILHMAQAQNQRHSVRHIVHIFAWRVVSMLVSLLILLVICSTLY